MLSNRILTEGHPLLAEPAAPVAWPDAALGDELRALHAALDDFRAREGFGRAISAPQIGISKRCIAVNLGATPFSVINPEITWRSDETFSVWDDCLSVPDKVVRLDRHRSISVRYLDEQGRTRHWHELPPSLAELMQHEIDHLDGVLMTTRAMAPEDVRSRAERDALVGPQRAEHRLSLESIARAGDVIDPVFTRSPQYECAPLSAHFGCTLTLKIESTNPIRSFKGRGAECFVDAIVARGDKRPLVCASAGNFGQALAWACGRRGRTLTVFAANNASPLKIERMRALGADVRLEGDDFDAAKAAARAFAKACEGWMVEDGDEPEISEGAGSIGVEMLARGDAFDTLLVSLGNGALLNGIARWVKAADPATRIVGVCASAADAMARSFEAAKVVENSSANTIADGIAVRLPVPAAVSDMKGIVDDVLRVDDDAIIEAMRLLHEHAGLVVEPAGAAGVAALVANPGAFAGQHVASVICGSNLTREQMQRWLGS